MEYTLQQPGRSIYKLDIESFTTGLSSRAGQRTRLFFFIFGEKMVQSAAIKQGRLANRKHTYFLGLSGSYNISSQIKVSHLFNTGSLVALSSAYF